MATMEQVLAALAPDEPQYRIAAQQFGIEALPYLEQLVQSPDALLASKATSLAAAIANSGSIAILEIAAHHKAIGPRAAAAYGIKMLRGPRAEQIVLTLMDDAEPTVAKFAVRAAQQFATINVKKKLNAIISSGANPFVIDEARRVLERIP
jgi:hypothetical protein